MWIRVFARGQSLPEKCIQQPVGDLFPVPAYICHITTLQFRIDSRDIQCKR